MNIGFIGTGNMGNPMAGNLVKDGHHVTVHDLNRQATINLEEMGASWADSPAKAAIGQDLVFTSLPTPQAVESVALGEAGIIESITPATVLADLSTNSPTVIRRIHKAFAERGVTVMDAPVSGGIDGALVASLAVMVGGDKAVFDSIRPVLGSIGSNVIYCGPIGNGMVCKICNNLVNMGIGVLMAESLTLGVKAGVDLAVLVDVMGKSSGGNYRLQRRSPQYLFRGNFEPGFAAALASKDVRLATDLGRELVLPMALSNLVDQQYVETVARGWGERDSDMVSVLQEEKAGVQLRLPV